MHQIQSLESWGALPPNSFGGSRTYIIFAAIGSRRQKGCDFPGKLLDGDVDDLDILQRLVRLIYLDVFNIMDDL